MGRHASAAKYSCASHYHIDGDQYMQHKAAGVEIDRVRHFLHAYFAKCCSSSVGLDDIGVPLIESLHIYFSQCTVLRMRCCAAVAPSATRIMVAYMVHDLTLNCKL